MAEQGNLFDGWAQANGFNKKQKTEAGEAIGLGERTRKRRTSMKDGKDMTKTEKLAMSAYAAGLPEYRVEFQKAFEGVRKMVEASADVDFSPIASKTPLTR